MPFRRFLDGRRRRHVAHRLYTAIIDQARQPVFYLRFQVPDTLDGRFDLIVLHAHLVMRGLGRAEGPARSEARGVSQALFDLMFADMENNLRELGVSDMSVGKRVKQMARAFYGRIAAYDQGLAGDDVALAAALARNLYRGLEDGPSPTVLTALAAYVRGQDATVAAGSVDSLLAGRVNFASVGEGAP